MATQKMPRYAVIVRWGSIEINIIGKAQVLGALAVTATLFGFRHYLEF